MRLRRVWLNENHGRLREIEKHRTNTEVGSLELVSTITKEYVAAQISIYEATAMAFQTPCNNTNTPLSIVQMISYPSSIASSQHPLPRQRSFRLSLVFQLVHGPGVVLFCQTSMMSPLSATLCRSERKF